MERRRRGLKPRTKGGNATTRDQEETSAFLPPRGPKGTAELVEEDLRKLEDLGSIKGQNPFVYGKLSNVGRIRASIITREDVEANGWVEITKGENPDLYDDNSALGSLYDPKLGPSSFKKRCATCNEDICPGHLGYIDFGKSPDQKEGMYVDPWMIPSAGPTIAGIMNLLTPCFQPVFSKNDLKRWNLSKTSAIKRIKALKKHFESDLKKQRLLCPIHGPKKNKSGDKVEDSAKNSSDCLEPIDFVKYNKEENYITDSHGNVISNTKIKQMFEKISPQAAALFGFQINRPSDLLPNFLIVIPPNLREVMVVSNVERRIDYFGQEYKGIIKKKNEIHKARIADSLDKVTKLTKDLHDQILHILSSKQSKKSFQRAGAQEMKGIKEILAGKEGDIRHLGMGKRVNRSGRCVISPNPNLRMGYSQLPKLAMEGQYMDIYITPWNKDALQKMLDNGKLVHYAQQKDYYRRWRFPIIKDGEFKTKLIIGDVVSRQLQEGDRFNFGRNPTIHKLGIMTQRVAGRTPGMNGDENTGRLFPAVCGPYNADFDGDEMHWEVLLELISQAEGRFISDVIRNIVNSENSSASMGLIMDPVIGGYIATSPTENGYYTVNKAQLKILYSLLTWNEDLNTLDTRLRRHGIDKYSMRGVLSATFPATYNLRTEAKDKTIIEIRDGILISGSLTKGNNGASRNSIIQEIYHYYSSFRAAYFITDLFRICNYFLSEIRGFTVSKSDLVEDDPTIPSVAVPALRRAYDTVYQIDRPTADPLEMQHQEDEILSNFKGIAENLAISVTKNALGGSNNFGNMARSGAKGDNFHLRQMVARGAGMGQQLFLNARLATTITNFSRNDHYSLPYDVDPGARGYVKETLLEGLSVRSTLAHHQAVRATLIDTTKKTVDAGEDHHLKNKSLIDLVVHYDNTTRDANGGIVQFVAGYIGLNPMHIVTVKKKKKNVEFYVDANRLFKEAMSAVEWDLDEEETYLLAKPVPMV